MRFHLIDALRGVAAIWVVLFHAYEGRHVQGLADALPATLVKVFFEWGELGVPIFFVLSGFVIAHSISKDKVDGRYFLKFTLRRSIRLDFPYWGSIALVIMMAWLSAQVKGEAYQAPSSSTIVAHLFYVQGLLEIPHINIIYWTLCLEIQFYLTFCLLTAVVQYFEKDFSVCFLVFFGVIAAISLLWPLKIVTDPIHPGLFLSHWYAFLLGVFAYWGWKKKIPSGCFYGYATILLVGAFYHGEAFGACASLTAIFISLCAQSGRITWANWRWLQFLGMISYSLYLTHNPVTGASYFVLYKLFGDTVGIQAIAFLLTTLACIIFAYLFWWAFESWSLRLSKKITLHNR